MSTEPSFVTLIRLLSRRIAEVRRLPVGRQKPFRHSRPPSLRQRDALSQIGSFRRLEERRWHLMPQNKVPFASRRIKVTTPTSQLLFHDPYVIIAPRRMAEAQLAQIVEDMPQVAFGRSSKFGTATASIAQALGAHEPARFSFDSTHSLLRFVKAGYG